MGSEEYLDRAAAPRSRRRPLRGGRSVVRRTGPGRAPGRASGHRRRAATVAGPHAGSCSPRTRCRSALCGRGDTYPDQLAESARLVAEAAGLADWLVAWQSAGRTPEPWLGPDVRDEVRRLGDRRARPRRSSSAPSASWPTTSRCSTTSTSSSPGSQPTSDSPTRRTASLERRPSVHGRAGRRRHRRRRTRDERRTAVGRSSSGVGSAAWRRPGS